MIFFKKKIIKKYRNKLKKIRNGNKEILKIEKNKISSIFNHDIKTVILAQIRSLELILSEKSGKINHSQKEIIIQNIDSNYFLLHLILNALFILNYEENNYKLNLQKVNLREEINNCVKEIKNCGFLKEQNFIINVKKDIKLTADKTLVRKIITNILSSSVSNGYEKTDIIVNAGEDKNSIYFSTKNKSLYMTKEKINSLFEDNKENLKDFNRLGMSLDLNIAKKLIKAHNWTLIANSKKDNSSTFGFLIEK